MQATISKNNCKSIKASPDTLIFSSLFEFMLKMWSRKHFCCCTLYFKESKKLRGHEIFQFSRIKEIPQLSLPVLLQQCIQLGCHHASLYSCSRSSFWSLGFARAKNSAKDKQQQQPVYVSMCVSFRWVEPFPTPICQFSLFCLNIHRKMSWLRRCCCC